MKRLAMLCAVLLIALPAVGRAAVAAKGKEKPKAAAKMMDPKEMEEMMMKLAAPGEEHEKLKKLAGNWDLVVKWTMDPSMPAQEAKSSAVVTTLMDGRYCQEQATGEMMGRPFSGMGITGYDNILKKYVSVWIDNMGTGIMKSEGTAAKDGKTIIWWGESSDPMTGKTSKYRLVTTFTDDDHHTFEMFGKAPDGKEMKMMTIEYTRKTS